MVIPFRYEKRSENLGGSREPNDKVALSSLGRRTDKKRGRSKGEREAKSRQGALRKLRPMVVRPNKSGGTEQKERKIGKPEQALKEPIWLGANEWKKNWGTG